ncbi:hypothetical protein K2173_014049 [Erythroxylum novogranatense]|uniref:Uncharacterized protein n=1 Tax=Erythroxylum novogranatense TaxID=1862640 RepID=A0AAV8SDK5_9ROSI|nr:hypothetical protein K2173_014049 [Erythroxylum novogranatense]
MESRWGLALNDMALDNDYILGIVFETEMGDGRWEMGDGRWEMVEVVGSKAFSLVMYVGGGQKENDHKKVPGRYICSFKAY